VSLPLVAIVGRPNVGKSRLFNRLAGEAKAIVNDFAGVTRDRNYARCRLDGRMFLAVDTGGFEPLSEDHLLAQMREQAQLAVEEAQVILFVVDVRVGRTPDDEHIAAILRQSGKRVMVVANKVDVPAVRAAAAEFYSLGFEELFPVSAEHGLGFDELFEAMAEDFPPDDDDELEEEQEELDEAQAQGFGEEDELLEGEEEAGEEVIDPHASGVPVRVAVVGKPNGGKSTLINRLLGSARLLTDNSPGTTRDSIDSELQTPDGRRYVLVDTAGIRRKRSISAQLEKYAAIRAIQSIEEADVVLLVIDVSEGVSDQDLRIAALAQDRGRAMAILLNKWDTVEEKHSGSSPALISSVRERFTFCEGVPVITISARSGQRVHKVLELVDKLYVSASFRVGTGELNRAFEQWMAAHPPPLFGNRPVKLYYVHQHRVRPPTFVMQLNLPQGVNENYRRYLRNRLRESFGFEGSPIRLWLRRPPGRSRRSKS
jgi:GTP-binding protein